MLRPRDGSRKAQIFDAFMGKGGLKEAQKLATKLDIKDSTLRSWVALWDRGKGEEITSAPVKRERMEQEAPVVREKLKPGEFDPHFRFKTREAAERQLISQAKSCGVRAKTLSVLENDGRFAIVPAWRKGMPIPQFKKGEFVYGMFMVDSKAKIVTPGPEQSVIRYVKESSSKARPKEECVPNYYLWSPAEIEGTSSKRERL
jgi:transposase-like protein